MLLEEVERRRDQSNIMPAVMRLCGRWVVVALFIAAPILIHAQSPDGSVQVVTVQGGSLQGNLSGDSPNRQVSVYLPSTYATNLTRRYPVVYLVERQ